MVRSILSEADAREVEAAVARAEGQSAAEIVVAVLPQSGEYGTGRALLAVTWALGAGWAFLQLEPWREPTWALLLEVVVGAAVWLLSGWRPLHQRLISPATAAKAVEARAWQLFAERGLQATRGRTGLLIFVSELERRVVLLGDRALDQRVGQRGWDEHVARLVGRIRAGQARAGLLEVLERLTPELSELVPRALDDENELPDAVVRG